MTASWPQGPGCSSATQQPAGAAEPYAGSPTAAVDSEQALAENPFHTPCPGRPERAERPRGRQPRDPAHDRGVARQTRAVAPDQVEPRKVRPVRRCRWRPLRRCWTGPAQDELVLALEEPVAAHAAGGTTLGRVLGIRRDLERPGLGARQRRDEPAMVTTTLSLAGSSAVKATARWPAASFIPAIPPAGRPWGRTEPAEKCSSCPSEEMKAKSSSPVASSAAPTTMSPSLRADDLPLVAVAGMVGEDPLDDALGGAERQPRGVGGQRGEQAPPRRPVSRQRRRAARRGQAPVARSSAGRPAAQAPTVAGLRGRAR